MGCEVMDLIIRVGMVKLYNITKLMKNYMDVGEIESG
jgi:hypothetical protein